MLLFYRYNMLVVLIGMCERPCWTMCGQLCVCIRKNNGELWFSRPSEHVSLRRDQQRLAQAASYERSLRRPTWFLSKRASRPSERGLA